MDLSIEKKKWGSSTAYEVVLGTESCDRSLAEHDGPPRLGAYRSHIPSNCRQQSQPGRDLESALYDSIPIKFPTLETPTSSITNPTGQLYRRVPSLLNAIPGATVMRRKSLSARFMWSPSSMKSKGRLYAKFRLAIYRTPSVRLFQSKFRFPTSFPHQRIRKRPKHGGRLVAPAKCRALDTPSHKTTV